MTGSKRGADEFEPQGPITRRTRRTLVESDEEEEDDDVSSSQASKGDHALRTAISDLFSSSSEESENEQEDHASTGEVSNGGDDELAGITAATKIDSRRMSARVVGHIKHLRQVRDYAKRQDRLLAKLEKKHARNRERRAAELRIEGSYVQSVDYTRMARSSCAGIRVLLVQPLARAAFRVVGGSV